ncbi:hypothetical protein N0V82_003569 [Gnomoniopsis sp. IMI 355080]|nr:hypothetical protein N0V82_003569 [Gnomoniopsis sp. IMI 355080]
MEYLQIDLDFHTNDNTRGPWIENLNKTGNEELIHEKFCNTLKHFHVRNEWPQEPFDQAIITDDTVLGGYPRLLNQSAIDANMVMKTGLRTD